MKHSLKITFAFLALFVVACNSQTQTQSGLSKATPAPTSTPLPLNYNKPIPVVGLDPAGKQVGKEKTPGELDSSTLLVDVNPGSAIEFSQHLKIPRPILNFISENVTHSGCDSLIESNDILIMLGSFYQKTQDEGYVNLATGNKMGKDDLDLSAGVVANWAPDATDYDLFTRDHSFGFEVLPDARFIIRNISIASDSITIDLNHKSDEIYCEAAAGVDQLKINFKKGVYLNKSLSELTIEDLKSILGDGFKVIGSSRATMIID